MVFFKSSDVFLDGFLDVLYRLIPARPLADASRQARAFRDPIAVLSGINDYLPHAFFILLVPHGGLGKEGRRGRSIEGG